MSEAVGVRRLREEFDAGFMLPLQEGAGGRVGLLLVRAGGRLLALGTAGLLSLERVGAVVAVDSAEPALVGLAGLGGTVLPVFSVGLLLGGEAAMSAEWERRPLFALVQAAGGERVGLAFDRLERFVQAEPETLMEGPEGRSVRVDGESLAVVAVEALLARLGG